MTSLGSKKKKKRFSSPPVDSSCFNGGTCTDKINGYSCSCRPGFTGSHCQYEVNECDSQPCLNGGVCQDAIESFRCSCPRGYTGNRCQVLARAFQEVRRFS